MTYPLYTPKVPFKIGRDYKTEAVYTEAVTLSGYKKNYRQSKPFPYVIVDEEKNKRYKEEVDIPLGTDIRYLHESRDLYGYHILKILTEQPMFLLIYRDDITRLLALKKKQAGGDK